MDRFQSSRPQKFFPRSPQFALESTRLILEDKLKLNEILITDELMPIYEKTGVKERPEIWVVRGLNNIVFKANEMIQSCNKELLIALPVIADDMSKLVLPTLRTLSEKGVKYSFGINRNQQRYSYAVYREFRLSRLRTTCLEEELLQMVTM